jgi:exosortase/archaeosortase
MNKNIILAGGIATDILLFVGMHKALKMSLKRRKQALVGVVGLACIGMVVGRVFAKGKTT